MSGGISVPIGLWALLSNASSVRGLAALAFAGLFSSFISLAFRFHGLQEQHKHRLKVNFDQSSQDCMVAAENAEGHRWTIARLRVHSESPRPIVGCKAIITIIRRDGAVVARGLNMQVDFSPAWATDAGNKTINHGVPEYLDVMAFDLNGNPSISARFPYAYQHFRTLNSASVYEITVAITATESLPIFVILHFEHKEDGWKVSLEKFEAPIAALNNS